MFTYSKNIIFFDSDCLLCSKIVKLILHKDNNEIFYLAPLQGSTASTLLDPKFTRNLDSVVVYSEAKVYNKSSAAKYILLELGGFYYFIGLFLHLFPSRLLDIFYDRISSSRYKMFGRSEACLFVNESNQHRFLS